MVNNVVFSYLKQYKNKYPMYLLKKEILSKGYSEYEFNEVANLLNAEESIAIEGKSGNNLMSFENRNNFGANGIHHGALRVLGILGIIFGCAIIALVILNFLNYDFFGFNIFKFFSF